MLKRFVRAALQKIGRREPQPDFDLAALASVFSSQLSLSGCSGRCNVFLVGVGLIAVVTLERARIYDVKLLSVVARVAIEKLRAEQGAEIKAVYWRHQASAGIERLALPPAADHRMEVTEVDYTEFESAQRANQAPVATAAQAAS